jgi:hypothetical protein
VEDEDEEEEEEGGDDSPVSGVWTSAAVEAVSEASGRTAEVRVGT